MFSTMMGDRRKQMEEQRSCYEMFRELLPSSFFKSIDGDGKRRGVFTTSLVAWLLIWQRLESGASMSDAMLRVATGHWRELNGGSQRVKNRRVSECTGGYSQARSNFSVESAEQISDKIFDELQAKSKTRAVFAIDGSTLELSSAPEVIKEYPPAQNQSGVAKNGILHFVVAHDLNTGYAVRPSYGAFFGNNLTTESQLCDDLMPRLPDKAIVVGDRNFGIFVSCHSMASQGKDIVVRLTEGRAKKIAQQSMKDGVDKRVVWTPSKGEQKKYSHLPEDAHVKGRVICRRIRAENNKPLMLMLFTTLEEPAEEIITLYGLRWKVELDLRTLKQTVNMQSLKAKTPQMVHKELLMGIAAYNLIRAMMYYCSLLPETQNKRLSFKQTLSIVQTIMPMMAQAKTKEERRVLLKKMLHLAKRATLPTRKNKPPAPHTQKTKSKTK